MRLYLLMVVGGLVLVGLVGQAGATTRPPDGDGRWEISGELKQWHKITLTLDGPFANESDNQPNPFIDYRLTVEFTHQSGKPSYEVPGYFAADGRAAESSATAGTKWRAHFVPDAEGSWTYRFRLIRGRGAALDRASEGEVVHTGQGKFDVLPTDKRGRDFRGHGRLQYVGQHYLRFAGSGQYFLKAGPDAPETLLAYSDFDGTEALKKNVPLKTWQPHVQDWRSGDPSWQGGKGKGLIGALTYLSSKGCNAFSFLPYNAGGDGQNVWPFIAPEDKLHYDCSKLDQWAIVMDHAQAVGLYLHFKLQEQENDDSRVGDQRESSSVAAALDGGELGVERKLYCRELVARFGHALALNWNLGEENTQSPEQQRAMSQYLRDVDPYDHHIVVHTFPGQQDEVYGQLVGDQSVLTGASLQNSWSQAHQRTLHWVTVSRDRGKPWVVANDEQNPASQGVPPDPGYQGHDGDAEQSGRRYNLHDIRRATLWGTLMAGGAGVEYYFGYQLPENDLLCQDFRSRDASWDYCRHALAFFHDHDIPFWDMQCTDPLVGNAKNDNSAYCFSKPNEVYVIYLPQGGSKELNLSDASGTFAVHWYNPREGGKLQTGSVKQVKWGRSVGIGSPPSDADQDWVVLVRRP